MYYRAKEAESLKEELKKARVAEKFAKDKLLDLTRPEISFGIGHVSCVYSTLRYVLDFIILYVKSMLQSHRKYEL